LGLGEPSAEFSMIAQSTTNALPSTTVDASPRRFTKLFGAVVVWCAVLAGGMLWSLDYDARPATVDFDGVVALPFTNSEWSSADESTADSARTSPQMNLFVFLHPHCPCSRATLSELAAILSETDGLLHATVAFVIPPEATGDWKQTELVATAAAMSGVDVRFDVDGREALRSGVATSGEALLFDRDDRLMFRGGITSARGHVGPNLGSEAVVEHAHGRSAPRLFPIFGCLLLTNPTSNNASSGGTTDAKNP